MKNDILVLVIARMAKLKTISKELPTLPSPLPYRTNLMSSTTNMGKKNLMIKTDNRI